MKPWMLILDEGELPFRDDTKHSGNFSGSSWVSAEAALGRPKIMIFDAGDDCDDENDKDMSGS